MSIYLDAIAVLEERGWHQGGLTGPNGEHCLVGAINMVTCGGATSVYSRETALIHRRERDNALSLFCSLIEDNVWPSVWNDEASTSYEDVVLLLKRAHEASESSVSDSAR